MNEEELRHDPEAWRRYFTEMSKARKLAEAEAENNGEPLEIIQPSRPATVADMNASLFKVVASLTLAGFWSAAQVTVVRQLGTLIKSGEKEGEMRPDKEITNVFIHAAHPDHRSLTIWYRDSKLENAQSGDKIFERMKDMEEYINGLH